MAASILLFVSSLCSPPSKYQLLALLFNLKKKVQRPVKLSMTAGAPMRFKPMRFIKIELQTQIHDMRMAS